MPKKYTENEPKPPSNGLMFPNNAPGLYVTPGKNELLLIMNTFDSIDEEIAIDNMPFNKMGKHNYKSKGQKS